MPTVDVERGDQLLDGVVDARLLAVEQAQVEVQPERERVEPRPLAQVLDRRLDVALLVGLDPRRELLLGLGGDALGAARRRSLRERALHRAQQIRHLEGLLQVGVDAVAGLEVLGEAPASIDGRDHHDRDVPVSLGPLHALGDVEAVHLGQHRVEDDEIGSLLLEQRERRVATLGLDHLVAALLEHAPHQLADVGLVVDDEHRLPAGDAWSRRLRPLGGARHLVGRQLGHHRQIAVDRSEVGVVELVRSGHAPHRVVDDHGRGRHRRRRRGTEAGVRIGLARRQLGPRGGEAGRSYRRHRSPESLRQRGRRRPNAARRQRRQGRVSSLVRELGRDARARGRRRLDRGPARLPLDVRRAGGPDVEALAALAHLIRGGDRAHQRPGQRDVREHVLAGHELDLVDHPLLGG